MNTNFEWQDSKMMDKAPFGIWPIRFRVHNLAVKQFNTSLPIWIGSVPMEQIEKVKHQVISEIAYSYWWQAGRPEGRDQDFWQKAIKDFNEAIYQTPWF